MKSALLSTASRSIPVTGPTAYADAEEKEEGEESKRFSALMDMIADACSKMDEGSKRMDARMDSFEERLGSAARGDAAKKDEDETEEEKKAKADAEEKSEEEKKAAADKARKDEDDMAADKARKDAEEKEAKEKAEADARKDEDEKEKEKAEADSVTISRAELDQIRGQITALNARAPQIISASDRERFASIQEMAEPVFQAFGDRAPQPLEGETPVQYKRRLGGKMQSHSKHWKDVRLSAIADEAAIDVAVDQIFADAISIGRRGADVPAGNLRPRETRTAAGHTRIEWAGDTKVLTGMFSGHLQRAGAAV